MQVRDLMTEEPFTVGPDEPILEVVRLMEHERIRHVPVVSPDGDLLGLVSHRDVVRHSVRFEELPLSMQREIRQTQVVEAFMVRDVETVAPDDDLSEVGALMLENKYGCVPVLDGAELVGILTEADFVRYVVESV